MPQSGREVVIVEAVRTPIGRGHPEKGYYKDVHANALLAKAYTAVVERAGIDAAEVEDVVAGCVQQFGEQGFNIARNAWLQAGLPYETPAATVDRQCGSAQQAVNYAAALIEFQQAYQACARFISAADEVTTFLLSQLLR